MERVKELEKRLRVIRRMKERILKEEARLIRLLKQQKMVRVHG